MEDHNGIVHKQTCRLVQLDKCYVTLNLIVFKLIHMWVEIL